MRSTPHAALLANVNRFAGDQSGTLHELDPASDSEDEDGVDGLQ